MTQARCSRCVNFTLKGQAKAGLGLYHCSKQKPYFYFNPFREWDCPIYEEVPADQLAARLKWEQESK